MTCMMDLTGLGVAWAGVYSLLSLAVFSHSDGSQIYIPFRVQLFHHKHWPEPSVSPKNCSGRGLPQQSEGLNRQHPRCFLANQYAFNHGTKNGTGGKLSLPG